MLDYGVRRAVLLRAEEPSLKDRDGQPRVVQLGKIVPVRLRSGELEWMYCNNPSAKMEKTDSFGVARCVIALLQVWDVPTICYHFGGVYYTIGVEDVVKMKAWAMPARVRYFNIPLSEWNERAPSFIRQPIPRTNAALTLDWAVPDPAVQQQIVAGARVIQGALL